MAKIFGRSDLISNSLLQYFGSRKSVVDLAIPNRFASRDNDEDSRFSRDEGDLSDFAFESRKQFLRQPSRSKKPFALGAVMDFDARPIRRGVEFAHWRMTLFLDRTGSDLA
jgi:hypothetical protein